MQLLWHRFNKLQLWIFGGIALVLPLIQIIQSLNHRLLTQNTFFDSPYTKWMGIDSFHFAATAFYLIIPLLAALPTASLIRKDLDSGFFNQLQVKLGERKVFFSYFWWAGIMGFLIVALPLIINLFTYFMILPNIHPDHLLNSNIMVINRNTLLVGLYYQYPLIHAILAILFAGFWGTLFAWFTLGWSLLLPNRFVAMTTGFLLQLGLLQLQGISSSGIGFAPYYFLTETNQLDTSALSAGSVTLAMLIVTSLLVLGGRRYRVVA